MELDDLPRPKPKVTVKDSRQKNQNAVAREAQRLADSECQLVQQRVKLKATEATVVGTLPPGWTTGVSRTTGSTYYVDPVTGKSQWERPEPKSAVQLPRPKAARAKLVDTTKKSEKSKWNHIELVVDRSGSMSSMATECLNGVNSFLEEQRKTLAPDERITVSLVTFDDRVEVPWANHDIRQAVVTAESICPRNMTALLDAIGETCARGERLVNSAREKPSMTVVIMTDGMENSSERFSQAQVNETITRLKAEGWTFIFLAANQDAIQTGGALGIDRQTSLTFGASGGGMTACFRSAGAAVARTRHTGQAAAFTPQERVASMDRQVATMPFGKERAATCGGGRRLVGGTVPTGVGTSASGGSLFGVHNGYAPPPRTPSASAGLFGSRRSR